MRFCDEGSGVPRDFSARPRRSGACGVRRDPRGPRLCRPTNARFWLSWAESGGASTGPRGARPPRRLRRMGWALFDSLVGHIHLWHAGAGARAGLRTAALLRTLWRPATLLCLWHAGHAAALRQAAAHSCRAATTPHQIAARRLRDAFHLQLISHCRAAVDLRSRTSFELRVDKRERDGAGIRNVEALDRARHIELCQDIAFLPAEAAQALAFGAEHKGERARERRLGEAYRR